MTGVKVNLDSYDVIDLRKSNGKQRLFLLVSPPVETNAPSWSYTLPIAFTDLNRIKVAKGGGDSTENITVHEVALEQVEKWLLTKEKEGCLIDPRIFAGFYHLNHQT